MVIYVIHSTSYQFNRHGWSAIGWNYYASYIRVLFIINGISIHSGYFYVYEIGVVMKQNPKVIRVNKINLNSINKLVKLGYVVIVVNK